LWLPQLLGKPGLLPPHHRADGTETVDIGAVLGSRGVDATNLTLIDVADGSTSRVDGCSLLLGPTPLVLEAGYADGSG